MPNSFDNVGVLSDLLLFHEVPEYAFESLAIANPTNAELTLPVGTPLTSASVPMLTAAVDGTGDVKYLTMEAVTLQDNETKKVRCLARGPAVLKKGGLPADDYAGDAFNTTNFYADIRAMPGDIVLRDALTTVEEHTT